MVAPETRLATKITKFTKLIRASKWGIRRCAAPHPSATPSVNTPTYFHLFAEILSALCDTNALKFVFLQSLERVSVTRNTGEHSAACFGCGYAALCASWLVTSVRLRECRFRQHAGVMQRLESLT
jgi:hypothetical protein